MRRAAFVFLVAAAGLAAPTNGSANDAGARERRAHVVAHVGAATIDVGDLEDRIANMPPFQRAGFGGTAEAVRRRFLTEVAVRETLLALGAEQQKLSEQPPAKYQIERAVSGATIRAIRGLVGPAAAISMADVQRYYDDNRARYDAPERYQVWRILCKTRDEANSVLDASKRDPTPANFGVLAREHSLDKATNLRAGNLGFVTADGSSAEPGLRVDPTVVRAAQTVRDGSLVPEPIAEGEYFSVVWRRGTIAARKKSIDDVAAQIRDTIWKARVKEETDKLVASLRIDRLHTLDRSLLDAVSIPVADPGIGPPKLHSDGAATAQGRR